jgi:hypothetical protein
MKKHVEHFLIGKKHEEEAKNKVKDHFNYKESFFKNFQVLFKFFWV